MEEIAEIAFRCFDKSDSGVVICHCRDDLPIIYCNETFCQMTGYDPVEVVGQNCRFLQGEDTSQQVRDAIGLAISEHRRYRIVVRNYRKDGTPFWNDLYLSPIRDDNGNTTHYLGIQNDIESVDRSLRSVPFNFPYDDLTQLPTPPMAVELLKMALERKGLQDRQLCLATITVNGLTLLRGFLNNSAADAAILEIRNRLQSQLQDTCVLARAGDAEFIVAGLVPEGFDARERLDQLCRSVLKPVRINGQHFQLTYNGGFIQKLPVAIIEESVRLCSFALAHARSQSRNTIVEFTHDDVERAWADQTLTGSIPTALETGEFYCAYQPQLNLVTREVIGFEALARWDHPNFGTISPGRFIPLCENSGHINALTLDLLRQIIRDLPTIHDTWGEVDISINLSPLSLVDDDFIQEFIRVAQTSRADNDKISIEVVENLSIDGYDSAAHNLNALKAAGFDIILDDFGTGYSSLSYIRKLGASFVKIDRDFIMNLTQDNQDDLEIIRAVVTLSRQFDFKVIAEGIEEQAQAELLLNEGVLIGQGYFFARPDRLSRLIG